MASNSIPKEFTLFPNLPLELWRKIWKASLNYDNLVEFRYSSQKQRIIAQRPVPLALHVCRESRNEAINQGYELGFGTRKSASLPEGHPPCTWLNFKFETASIDFCHNKEKHMAMRLAFFLVRTSVPVTTHPIVVGFRKMLTDTKDIEHLKTIYIENLAVDTEKAYATAMQIPGVCLRFQFSKTPHTFPLGSFLVDDKVQDKEIYMGYYITHYNESNKELVV